MQQDRNAAVPDMRAQRLNQLARRGMDIFKKVPPAAWRFLAALLLVLWLGHSLARLFWLVMPEPEVSEAQVAANALISDRSSGGGGRVDIAALKQIQVFGRLDEAALANQGSQAPVSDPGIEDEAVDTQLRLTLQGIVDSNEEGGGRAIIASGSRQAIYGPGDELPEGQNVTLEKVLPLRVILNNNGRYESLWLYQEGEFSSSRRTSGPVPDTPSRSWEGDESELTDTPIPEEAVDEPDYEPEARAEVEAEDRVQQVSQSLSDVVSMSIHRENGQIVGYKIRPGRDSAMFDSLGLETGDVVKAVNGTELTSPQKVMELYRNMGDARSASLLIERNGQELSVDIDLE